MRQKVLHRQGNLFEQARDVLPFLSPEQRHKLLHLIGVLLLETTIEDSAVKEDGDDEDHA